jgi:hypothetical protein
MVDDAWLGLVRVAQDAGDVSSLLPPGLTSLYDAPYTVIEAIRMAMFYNSFSALPENERPPRSIWEDGEKMEAWWREVKFNRKNGTKDNANYSDMARNELLDKMFAGSKRPG